MNPETDSRPMASEGSMTLRNNDILIVNNEIPNLQLLAMLLEKEGYQVRLAVMAQVAIDSALAKPPILILLDVSMPEMDGFEVCRRLKQDKRTCDIPIIFVSALRDTDERVRGFELGGVDFITRPFQELEVLARVRTHIQLHRIQLHLEQLVDERVAQLEVEIAGHKEVEVSLHEQEAKARKCEERFRGLMEQSYFAIEILTPEGQIAQVNDAWMRLWDINEEETAQVLAKYNMLTDQQTVDLGIEPLIRKAFAGEPVILPSIKYVGNQTAEDIGLQHIKGNTSWIQCHLSPVKNTNQEIEFVINTYVDVTELKRIEREVREQRDALARVERATSMGQLTGSIAHELNQPLTGILSNAQSAEIMIKKGQCDYNELADAMAEIVADTKRAGDVIRNLQELYREQKGEFLPVDINAVVNETIQLLHSEFVMQHIVLTTECTSSIPMVDGNRIQLQQILVNLIMNGNQAMSGIARDNRQLHIGTEYDANEVKAWVEDYGLGIDSDKIDRIFEPLATWKPGGTGMGLAISNSIAEAHGGRMWAENQPMGGARVGFALPILKEDQQA